MWAWSGSREQFLHCGLRKFRHSKSSVYRWYTQLDRLGFVYDTYKTMKAIGTRHGWVQMFTTHRPTLTLQLHNFDLFRTFRTALLRGNWQDFNWHDASRGPSAIAELLVLIGEYLAKLQAVTKVTVEAWLSHALCTPGQRTAKRRLKWLKILWMRRMYKSWKTYWWWLESYYCFCIRRPVHTAAVQRRRTRDIYMV